MNILTKIRLINELNLKELKQGVSSDLILTSEMTPKGLTNELSHSRSNQRIVGINNIKILRGFMLEILLIILLKVIL